MVWPTAMLDPPPPRRRRRHAPAHGCAAWRALVGLGAGVLALLWSGTAIPSAAGSSSSSTASSNAGWRRDEPCGVLLPPPEPATRDGCARGHCVADGDAREVCVCAPPADDDGAFRASVRDDGRETAGWPIEPMLGDSGAFRVARADLDGDARDELLVAILTSVSNGMAVQAWSVCVVAPELTTRPPSCVAADDFPFLTMAVRARGERGCRLLAARWLWGSEPGRGDGLYLVGRSFCVRDGELVLDAQRPAIARRYLYRFAAERADAVENARLAPIAWWRDPTTRVVPCPDPLCDETKEER